MRESYLCCIHCNNCGIEHKVPCPVCEKFDYSVYMAKDGRFLDKIHDNLSPIELYAVVYVDWDTYIIHGIYSTLDKAKERLSSVIKELIPFVDDIKADSNIICEDPVLVVDPIVVFKDKVTHLGIEIFTVDEDINLMELAKWAIKPRWYEDE